MIFGHFCDFGKITKMAKNPFFILKGGNFFKHTLIIWGDNFFVFSILFDSIKKNGQNWKKALSRTAHFFSFWPKNAKKSIFMKRSFSNNFSMSNFGQKRFSILLNPLEPFCWRGYSTRNFSLKGWYRTLLCKMALAGSNIDFCQKYRKLSEITHRKIPRKRFFHENWYFWHFWAKNAAKHDHRPPEGTVWVVNASM